MHKGCCPPADRVWWGFFNISYFFFYPVDARGHKQFTHTQKKLLSDLKTPPLGVNTAWCCGPLPGQWKSTDLFETQSMGQPFSDQTVFCFLKQHLQGFWLYKSYIYARKDSTVVLIRVLLFIQSRQMTTNTEPSHAQCFFLLKAQVFPTTVAKLLSLKGACCVHVNKYLMHILYLDKKKKLCSGKTLNLLPPCALLSEHFL